MGFIRAFTGAIGGTFADQWKDFIVPKPGMPATAAIYSGVMQGQDGGRGANRRGSDNVITNGSKIVVPEGTAMITMQDGAITGFIAEPGGYTFTTEDSSSQSIFAGDGIVSSLIRNSWERFKFGGIPAAQQHVFYVNLREIPNNKFGTQSEIFWDDAFLGTQVGALTRGTYTMKITDPILFIRGFVPPKYLTPNAPVFDFADMNNDAGTQLFNEVVSSLAGAFSRYTNDPDKGNRMTRIQSDQIGFALSLSSEVEEAFQWRSGRGLEIVRVAIVSIEYDADTREILSQAKRGDALGGNRGNALMQQAAARGMEAMGSNPNGGGMGMAFMGMGMNQMGGMMNAMQQPVQQQPIAQQPMFDPQTGQPLGQPAPRFDPQTGQPLGQPAPRFDPHTGQPLHQPVPQFDPHTGQPLGSPSPQFDPNTGQPLQSANPSQSVQPTNDTEDPVARLIKMQNLLDNGLISQEEFDKVRSQILGF